MTSAAPSFDVVIRSGTIVDGTGAEPYVADLAIANGMIAQIGDRLAAGGTEIEANGLLVTPGFVDIHTHYDGQITWESNITPSAEHGVTTIVTGNCGVGFAPCEPGDRNELIELMAGVEDIPEVVLADGLGWDWRTFPEYLDAVERRPHNVDIAAMLPHSALRVFVMGERAVNREKATPADIERMSELAYEAIRAGAIGFGTSRALQQKSTSGEPIPTVRAAEDELLGILQGLRRAGSGAFQALSDFELFTDVVGEFAMLCRLVRQTGIPMSFTLNQKHDDPDRWREIAGLLHEAVNDGLPIKGQVLCRPAGLMLGYDVSFNPFMECPTYMRLSHLPLDERVEQLRRPEIRGAILAEAGPDKPGQWECRFPLTDPPNYEPDPSLSFAATAKTLGITPAELAYDVLLEDDGHRLIMHCIQNYAEGSLDSVHDMMTHPDTVLGLGDGGAHLGLICDASYPTSMLSFWTRDRTRGPKFSVPDAVKALTSQTADVVGLCDRGRLLTGYKADINVIDYDRLRLRAPQVVHDLPTGGRRMIQRAEGYVATLVNGTVTHRDGTATGAMPGHLVRGMQPAPAFTEETSSNVAS
jgi:N-acyl-D-aspartate/D-glutamate deacylase